MNLKLLLFVALSFLPASAIAAKYDYAQENISFDFGSLVNDQKATRSDPLSVAFRAGRPPFAITILFKKEASDVSLENFISQQRKEQEKGGYKRDVTTAKVVHAQYIAYEIVRNGKSGAIHWFVFQPKKSADIYSFWFSETAGLKNENKHAVENYNLMKKTLKIEK